MPVVIFGLVIFVALWIIFCPLLALWAMNTLFHFGIPYTFWTWLAVWILIVILSGKIEYNKGKKQPWL